MAVYLPILTSFNDKGLKQAEKGFKDLEGAQAKAKYALGKANKYAAVALAGLVAGLGDAVKGAMEDEQAQALLARQLQKTTAATDAQIKGVEAYITQQGKLKGVTDDELRPALAGLVRATMDIDEAQKAANLSMDIAAMTSSIDAPSLIICLSSGDNFASAVMLPPYARSKLFVTVSKLMPLAAATSIARVAAFCAVVIEPVARTRPASAGRNSSSVTPSNLPCVLIQSSLAAICLSVAPVVFCS